MFPKTKKEIDPALFKFGMRFLQKDLELVIDRMKCVGCGICSTVCPKDAIVSGPKTKGKDEHLHSVQDDMVILDVSDPTDCVYCGTCTYFCPFDAIHLYENQELKKRENLDVVMGKALPELVGENKMLKNIKREAFIYMNGTVEIQKLPNEKEAEFKLEYVNNCPGECSKCIDICPNGALERNPYEEAIKTGIPIKLDEELCIACGACALACPSDRITLKRDKIFIKGSYNAVFFNKIMEKLGVTPEIVDED